LEPLHGVRVLDLSRLLPGPFASLVLADMGAAVDKVEDPGGGDYLRHMPPVLGKGGGGESSIFLALNRNKRSIVLDLKKKPAQDALLDMVPRYDVVLEQFRPGVLDRLGLAHAKLLEKNPRLVVCALTGYGQDGPLAKRAGHDINYLARAGVLGFQGPAGQAPAVPGFQLADVSGGLYAVIGILGGLRERDRTGKGSIVDVAMLESAMGFAASGFGALFGGQPIGRGEGPLTGGIAPYRTYATKDAKYMSLGALEPKFWLAFCAAVGLEADMGALMPGPHQAALQQKLEAIFASKTRGEWEAIARASDFCLEPVLEPGEVLEDAHAKARGLFFDLETPWGKAPQMRLPVTPRDKAHTAPPRQGEHSEIILREAGFDDARIAALRAEGAIPPAST
jgi:crotonobetainyl-CoA:carnitine CoA-transferase CaiB-like acyl-CoA transferase